ncbi:MAG TPA: GNAT family N-acetyltransferase [Pyrinomonadaceae bacterium]|nr:GNAT family N-acetyltransferase [Pyrinomonadaceae bacterium]
MTIVETDRLSLRELEPDTDAAFVFELLNTPSFLRYIGDRGVRSVERSRAFIEEQYCASYRNNGFGLYLVALKSDDGTRLQPIGICGFVKRDHLDAPDIGFAFLPEFERRGFGYESAAAILEYGRTDLGFRRVLAITSQDNDNSGKLLIKLGFSLSGSFTAPSGEELKLYEIAL